MLTPPNWYILQRSGLVYLCDGKELKTVVHTYAVKEKMVLHVYDDTEEYRLEPKLQHMEHRQRTYNFTVEFCVWNMPRHPLPPVQVSAQSPTQ
jgi:hypothetical protein